MTYNANAQTAAGTATGVEGANLGALLNLSGTTHTSAGEYTDIWTFTDPDGNYQNATGTVIDFIRQAAATVTADNESKVYGTTLTLAGTEFTDSGLFGTDCVTSVTLSSVGTAASALVGTYPITPGGATGTGLANYNISYAPGVLSVIAEAGSVFVLDKTASGAVTVSGSAQLKVLGNLIVDSGSSSALTTTGNASVKAAAIQVTGCYQKGSGTTINPAPVTGVAAVADPLGGASGPNPAGMLKYGAENLTGSAKATIYPGIYTSISVSTSAKLTLATGIYVIEGGGLSVSDSASIVTSGGGVLIVNAGSNYPTVGGRQTYGSITVSDSASIDLSPYTKPGAYAGMVIDQTTDNNQAMTLSGAAIDTIGGTIFAPAAALRVSNSAAIQGGVVVDTLTVSNSEVAMAAEVGSDAPDSPLLEDSELLTDVAVSLITVRRAGKAGA